jgi:hypothetical protein
LSGAEPILIERLAPVDDDRTATPRPAAAFNASITTQSVRCRRRYLPDLASAICLMSIASSRSAGE